MKHTGETVVEERWITGTDTEMIKRAMLIDTFRALVKEGAFDSSDEVTHFYVKIKRTYEDGRVVWHPAVRAGREYHVVIEVSS